MNAKIQSQAEKIYQTVHVTTDQLKFYGEANIRLNRPIAFATVVEIAEFLQNVEDAQIAAGLHNLDASKIKWGTTRDEIFALAESKRKAQKKSAGARAMVAKYGKTAAQEIIYNKTGKHYNLRG